MKKVQVNKKYTKYKQNIYKLFTKYIPNIYKLYIKYKQNIYLISNHKCEQKRHRNFFFLCIKKKSTQQKVITNKNKNGAPIKF